VFLLVPAYPGCPRPKAVKRLCVCVCVCFNFECGLLSVFVLLFLKLELDFADGSFMLFVVLECTLANVALLMICAFPVENN